MELFFVVGAVLSLTMACVFVIFQYSRVRERVPPGTRGLPWVGETIEFLSLWWQGRPEEFVRERVARYASPDVFKTSLLGEAFAVICGAPGSKFLFSTGDQLVKSWWPNSIHRLFSQTLQESHKLKDLTLLSFSTKSSLERFVQIMDSIARSHLESRPWSHDQVKVFPLVKNYTFALACRIFMSIEDLDLVAKLEASMEDLSAGFMAITINFPGTRFHRAIEASKRLKQQLAEIAKQRRISTGQSHEYQDTLQLLLPSLSDMDIADRILGLLVGGHDTSSIAIAFIFKYLADHPQAYRRVLEENLEVVAKKTDGELLNWEDVQQMKYSWNVTREVMRIWAPSPAIFREAKQDFTYAGYHIPKGWKLYVNLSSIHKDPKYFPEPEKFDPSRFEGDGPLPYTYLPFGGGSNICPGRNYARLQILVFLHNVVKRFHWETVHPNEAVFLNPVPRPAQGLPVRLHRHVPNPI